jgi:dynactin complex subunit
VTTFLAVTVVVLCALFLVVLRAVERRSGRSGDAQPAIDRINALEAALGSASKRAFESRARDRQSRRQRDEWRKLFNRLEASVTHHKTAKLYGIDTSDEIDEALWTARDKVLRDAAALTPTRTTLNADSNSKDLDESGAIGNEPDDAMHLSIDHRPVEPS